MKTDLLTKDFDTASSFETLADIMARREPLITEVMDISGFLVSTDILHEVSENHQHRRPND